MLGDVSCISGVLKAYISADFTDFNTELSRQYTGEKQKKKRKKKKKKDPFLSVQDQSTIDKNGKE